MKFLSALVLFLSLAFVPNPALAASPAHQLYDEAASLDRDGFFDEAAAAWEALLKSDPEKKFRTIAMLKLASTYFKLAEFEKSIQTANKLTIEQPGNFHAFFHLANIASGTGNFSDAIKAFQKTIELKPEEGLGRVGLALSHFGNKEADQALEILRDTKTLFKKQRNISWHRNVRIMINQIRGFDKYPPDFAYLWLENNFKLIRETYYKALFDPEKL